MTAQGNQETIIEWVNHASFIVRSGHVGLLVDPWFSGSVFDDGWDLLCETPPIDMHALTDIWISHEHPDHFHPPSLRSIPPAMRSRLGFWFQHTRDGKVATYAHALGFASVTECRRGRWYGLGPGISLRVEPWGTFDSILVLRTPAGTIVDLNDCKTRGTWNATRLARRLRDVEVDVLITQVEAGDDVDMLVEQVEALRPRTVIPGASFVWFSHEENAHHNDQASHIDRAWQRLRDRVDADVVVLYPGDHWQVGTTHDTPASLVRYAHDYDRLAAGRPLHHTESISREQLSIDAAMWGARLRTFNGQRMISVLRRARVLEPATVYVSDHEQAYAVSNDGITTVDVPIRTCDAVLSSSALDAVFKYPWGGNTLSVNGRVEYPPAGNARRFRRWTAMSSYNNHGYRIGQVIPQAIVRGLRR